MAVVGISQAPKNAPQIDSPRNAERHQNLWMQRPTKFTFTGESFEKYV